jgi:hypothetical protein
MSFAEYKEEIIFAWSGFYQVFINAVIESLTESSSCWKRHVIADNFVSHTVPALKAIALAFRLLGECSQYTLTRHSGQQLYMPGLPISTRQISDAPPSGTSIAQLMRTACPYLAITSKVDSSLCSMFTISSTTAESFAPQQSDLRFLCSVAAILGQMALPIKTMAGLYADDIRKYAKFSITRRLIRSAPSVSDFDTVLVEACLSDCSNIFDAWITSSPLDKHSIEFCPKISELYKWGNRADGITARSMFILYVCIPVLTQLIPIKYANLSTVLRSSSFLLPS